MTGRGLGFHSGNAPRGFRRTEGSFPSWEEGWSPTIAFILYFPLWYNGLFDFHIDHLAVPFIFGFLMMEKKGAIGFSVLFGFFFGRNAFHSFGHFRFS